MKVADAICNAFLCVAYVLLPFISCAGEDSRSPGARLPCSVEVRRTSQVFEPFERPDIKLNYNIASDCTSDSLNIKCMRLLAERGAVWLITCEKPSVSTTTSHATGMASDAHLLVLGVVSGIRVLRLADPYVLGEEFSVNFSVSDFGLGKEMAESLAKQMERLDGAPARDFDPRLQNMIMKAMKESSVIRIITNEFRKVGLTVKVCSFDPVRLTPYVAERTWKESALLPNAGLPERLFISVQVLADSEGWRKFDSLQNPCGYSISEVSESLRGLRFTDVGNE